MDGISIIDTPKNTMTLPFWWMKRSLDLQHMCFYYVLLDVGFNKSKLNTLDNSLNINILVSTCIVIINIHVLGSSSKEDHSIVKI